MKTTLKATHAQRTLKSNNISNVNKRTSVAAISSKKREEAVTSSLPANIALVDPQEATEGQPPSDADGNPRVVPHIIATKKSARRRSYTSSLMARSKVEAHYTLVMHWPCACEYQLQWLLCCS